jgi:hypothetical protein
MGSNRESSGTAGRPRAHFICNPSPSSSHQEARSVGSRARLDGFDEKFFCRCVESQYKALSPYLFDAGQLADRHLVVREVSKPINGQPKLITGTQPLENDELTFSDEQRAAFIAKEPKSAALFRPFPGSQEYINGQSRWILHTLDQSPSTLRSMPLVVERLNAVRAFRKRSKRKTTLAIADYPSRYGVTVIPERPFLAVPQVSSERREYIPMGWLEPPTIPSEKLRVLLDADLWQFGILTSRMHMAWMRAITGRLESRYMYSVGVVYNNFPWPQADQRVIEQIRTLAKNVLIAREKYPGSTLADLYDPDVMPPELRKAHRALDAAVDGLYRGTSFNGDRERVEHLFTLYERMISPLIAQPKGRRARARV